MLPHECKRDDAGEMRDPNVCTSSKSPCDKDQMPGQFELNSVNSRERYIFDGEQHPSGTKHKPPVGSLRQRSISARSECVLPP